MRISDWSSDVCSSDLETLPLDRQDVEDLIMHFDEAALAWCKLPPAMAMTNVVRTRSDLTSMLKIRRASIEDTPTVLNLVPRLIDLDRKSTRLNSSQQCESRMPSSA